MLAAVWQLKEEEKKRKHKYHIKLSILCIFHLCHTTLCWGTRGCVTLMTKDCQQTNQVSAKNTYEHNVNHSRLYNILKQGHRQWQALHNLHLLDIHCLVPRDILRQEGRLGTSLVLSKHKTETINNNTKRTACQ